MTQTTGANGADISAVASKGPFVRAFEMTKASGTCQAVISSYDESAFSPDQRAQHSVAIFWEFEQKLFAAHLNYNVNDPNGPALENVFLETVRSIRPLEKADQH